MIVTSDNLFEVVLKKQFKTRLEASSEIINLKAILDLPKPTEHFLSDLHGEYYAFRHMLKNSSGLIKSKIDAEFSHFLSPTEKDKLAICILYPKEIIHKAKSNLDEFYDWQKDTIKKLVRVMRVVSRKYTRSKVRKTLPDEYSYIIEELLYETDHGGNKQEYYNSVVNNIIQIGISEDFIIEMCETIQRLSIDSLHIVGDIFDRGAGPHKIIDELMKYSSVDIQWGNHDIVWMGAACGSKICIANVIRICTRYGNLSVLEDGYGINLGRLFSFAERVYKDDKCSCFGVKAGDEHSERDKHLLKKVHKAIAIIQFKLEGQLSVRNPKYEMQGRLLLDKITEDGKSVNIGGKLYELMCNNFPTVDRNNPYELSEVEKEIMDSLQSLFMDNEKLNRHLKFLFKKGNIYLIYNYNLLLHGCIPMDDDGKLSCYSVDGNKVSGKKLLDMLEDKLRYAYEKQNKEDSDTDIFWYLWAGKNSPVFGKKEMKTFERYFIDDEHLHKEELNPYYGFWDDEDKCSEILREFGIKSEFAHIINGHVPVRAKFGESPLKANGKLIVIDGGLNPIYNPITGTAGYTLIYDSYGLVLAAHEQFVSCEKIIEQEKDIVTYFNQCDRVDKRIRVGDTDVGKKLHREIKAIEKLLEGYKTGRIKES